MEAEAIQGVNREEEARHEMGDWDCGWVVR